jgi:hypothetical protein
VNDDNDNFADAVIAAVTDEGVSPVITEAVKWRALAAEYKALAEERKECLDFFKGFAQRLAWRISDHKTGKAPIVPFSDELGPSQVETVPSSPF